jgi:hypothetical protein
MGNTGGYGVTFRIGNTVKASSPTYAAIANVMEFNGMEIGSVMADISAHDSTAGFREKIPSGLFEVGDVELTLAFDSAEGSHANASGGLTYALLNKSLLGYQIAFPNTAATTWTFDAYCSKIAWQAPLDGAWQAIVTLTVTGQPALT